MAFIKASGYSDFSKRIMDSSEVGTGPPALALVKQSGLFRPDLSKKIKLFDNACGAGIVTKHFLSSLSEVSDTNVEVVCGDLDLRMIEFTKDRASDLGWPSSVRVEKIDSHDTGLPDAAFTHVLMNFGPQLMKDPKQMLNESLRVLEPGGTIGFTTWLAPGFLRSMKVVFPDFSPDVGPLSASDWRDTTKIIETLTDVGFGDAKIETVQFETEDPDLDGYLELFTGILMEPFFRTAGEEAKVKYADFMKRPGNLKMQWVALAVTATKPSQ